MLSKCLLDFVLNVGKFANYKKEFFILVMIDSKQGNHFPDVIQVNLVAKKGEEVIQLAKSIYKHDKIKERKSHLLDMIRVTMNDMTKRHDTFDILASDGISWEFLTKEDESGIFIQVTVTDSYMAEKELFSFYDHVYLDEHVKLAKRELLHELKNRLNGTLEDISADGWSFSFEIN